MTHKEQLIAKGNDWPTGVVGLVAGRLTDRNYRPSMVISEFNGELIGSGRSIPEFNMIEAVESCNEFLAKYGGHAQACGFTLKNNESLEKFLKKMTELADKQIKGDEVLPEIDIDAEVNLDDVDWELFDDLIKFQPFGAGNFKPKFLARNLTVKNPQPVGNEGKHLRLMVQHDSKVVRKTIGFGFGDWCDKLKEGDKVDLIFEVDVNEWNGNRELQLKIVDLKMSK